MTRTGNSTLLLSFGKREDVGIPGKDTTNHNGLDIAYPYGTPILAVEAGTVIKGRLPCQLWKLSRHQPRRRVLHPLRPLQPAFGSGWRYGEQIRHHCQSRCYRRCDRKSSAYLRHYRRGLRQPKRVSALKQRGLLLPIRRSSPPIFYLSEQYRQIICPAVQYSKNLYRAAFLIHMVENQLL